jgi:hypothetical protein
MFESIPTNNNEGVRNRVEENTPSLETPITVSTSTAEDSERNAQEEKLKIKQAYQQILEIFRREKQAVIDNVKKNIETFNKREQATMESLGSVLFRKAKKGLSQFIKPKPKEKTEKDLAGEVIKAYVKDFFSDKVHANELLVEPHGDKYIKIKTTLNMSDEEAVKYPNFSVGVELYISLAEVEVLFLDQAQSTPAVACDIGKFTIGGQEFDLMNICPVPVQIYIGNEGYQGHHAQLENVRIDTGVNSRIVINPNIFLNRLASPLDFMALLHEIGHVVNSSTESQEDLSNHFSNLQIKDKTVADELEEEKWKVKNERDAWAQALKIARKNNIPIEKSIQEYAEDCLGTYQKGAEINGHNDMGFTGEKRREIRSGGVK